MWEVCPSFERFKLSRRPTARSFIRCEMCRKGHESCEPNPASILTHIGLLFLTACLQSFQTAHGIQLHGTFQEYVISLYHILYCAQS